MCPGFLPSRGDGTGRFHNSERAPCASAPNFENALLTTCLGPSTEARSPRTLAARLPSGEISRATSSASCADLLLCTITLAPAYASFFAMAAPIPREETGDQRDPIIWMAHFDISDLVLCTWNTILWKTISWMFDFSRHFVQTQGPASVLMRGRFPA
jgi:hypothetical protein